MYGFFTLNDQCKVTKLLNVVTASMADEVDFSNFFYAQSQRYIEIYTKLFRYHISSLKSMQDCSDIMQVYWNPCKLLRHYASSLNSCKNVCKFTLISTVV